MKIRHLLATIAAILALASCSCADWKLAGLSVETPYGSINSDKLGRYTVVLRPIIIEK